MMKNLYTFICVIEILMVFPIFARDLASQSPILKQFVVDANNNVIGPYTRVDEQHSQIIAEKLDYLRLECHANYPVQWIYTGDGIPFINSKTVYSNTNTPSSTALSRFEILDDEVNPYIASVFLGPLKEHHTGNYHCSRTDHVTLTPKLYIYVPGPHLFTCPEGKTIRINPNVTSTLIPCAVSHPSAQVELLKLENEVFTWPVTKSRDAFVYHPRTGFRIKLNEIENPEGRYLCTARCNDVVSSMEYTITSKSIRSRELNADIQCRHHRDCPRLLNCYPDFKCRDSYKYSNRCGKGSLCRIMNNNPECYCPSGFYGDPTKECYRLNVKQSFDMTCPGDLCKECNSHSDCPPLFNCYTDFKCRDSCSYSIRCGKGSLCQVIDNRPVCYCPPGFIGDPTKECCRSSDRSDGRIKYNIIKTGQAMYSVASPFLQPPF